MDNNLIKLCIQKIIAMCLWVGMLLFLSCGSNNDNENPAGDINNFNSYLQLQPYGVNTVKVSSNDKSYQYTFEIKKNGNTHSSCESLLEVWSEAELKLYNEQASTTYQLLPSSLYSISSTKQTFTEGISSQTVKVELNPSRIFTEYIKSGQDFVIALRLCSDDIKVRERQDVLILPIIFDYPTIRFTTSLQEVSAKEEISVYIEAAFDYKIDGKKVVNPWNFSCDIIVPFDAEKLIVEYNKNNKTSCQLLPKNNYDIVEILSFKQGKDLATAKVNIYSEGLPGVNYLLPLQLTNCSNDGVICQDEIYYIKVGKTYTNPIISVRSAADPTVIRAQDGYFYLYTTETDQKWVPIYKSKDLVNWEYERTAFKTATRPSIPGGGAFWAPEIRYINGKYVLYFSWSKWGDGSISYTAVATSDSPLGEFPDSKALITNEEFGSNVIDQFYYEDGGKKYMFFGSFNGIFVTELTDDGLSVKRGADGKPVLKKQVAGRAFEATNIYKKGDYYYLFASINNCCDGVNSKYKVVVGRSKDVLGPYVDKSGKDMLNNSWELVLEGDGQKWFGPGHNAIIIQDDAGTDWMIYHSYMKDASGNVGGRLGMLDRILWEDGWPSIKNKVPSNSDLIPVFNH